MSSDATTSAEISIAVLSWINDQLRSTVVERETRRQRFTSDWARNAATSLTVGLSGLCVLMLQRWA